VFCIKMNIRVIAIAVVSLGCSMSLFAQTDRTEALESADQNGWEYELKAGARVYEAIKMAGGFLENANSQNLNLAAKLSDQDKIVVLTDEEADTKCGSPEQSGEVNGFSSQAQIGGKVNINNATVEELQTIKGIGPAMAARILEYRRSNGGFASVDDLRNVKGIGEKTFAKLRESIKV